MEQITIIAWTSSIKGGVTTIPDYMKKGFEKAKIPVKVLNIKSKSAKKLVTESSSKILLIYWFELATEEILKEALKQRKKVIVFPARDKWKDKSGNVILEKSFKVIANAPFWREKFLEETNKRQINSNKIFYFPWAIREGEIYNKDLMRKKLKVKTKFVIGQMGFVRSQKGFLGIVDFLEDFQDTTYLILGTVDLSVATNGYLKELEKALNKKLPNRYIWIKRQLTEEEIDQYSSITDLMVAPSLTLNPIQDTTGTITLSLGLNKGTPVITTPSLLRLEIANKYKALKIVEWKNFRNGIRNLLDNEKERKELEMNAKRYVKKFNWTQFARRINQEFKQ